jgi:hypothetical protein
MGGCGGSKMSGARSSSSQKASMPKNWGGMKGPKSSGRSTLGSATNFGTPKVRMSFSGKARRGY